MVGRKRVFDDDELQEKFDRLRVGDWIRVKWCEEGKRGPPNVWRGKVMRLTEPNSPRLHVKYDLDPVGEYSLPMKGEHVFDITLDDGMVEEDFPEPDLVETDLLEKIQGYCIPQALQSLLTPTWRMRGGIRTCLEVPEPVGLDQEILKVQRHLEARRGGFMLLVAPKQCGKSEVVQAALRRMWKDGSIQDFTGVESMDCPQCPHCTRPGYLCTTGFLVLEIDKVRNHTEAMVAMERMIESHPHFKAATAVIDRKDCSSRLHLAERRLMSLLEGGQVRVVFWMKQFDDLTRVQSLVYFFANLVHNRDAAKNMSVIAEACNSTTMHEFDARIRSRLSAPTLQFRPLSPIDIAKFVATRLRVEDGLPTMQPGVGESLSGDLHTTMFYDRSKKKGELLAVDLKEDEQCLNVQVAYIAPLVDKVVVKTVGPSGRFSTTQATRHSNRMLNTVLWPPPFHKVVGMYYRSGGLDGKDIHCFGCVTQYLLDPPDESLLEAIQLWNMVTCCLAENYLVQRVFKMYGSILQGALQLRSWLSSIASPAAMTGEGSGWDESVWGTNPMKQLNTILWDANRRGAKGLHSMVYHVSRRLARHFWATARCHPMKLPLATAEQALSEMDDEKFQDRLNSALSIHAACGCVPLQLGQLSNPELVLLCLLMNLQHTQDKKQLTAEKVQEQYERHECCQTWDRTVPLAFRMTADLQTLIDLGLVRILSNRRDKELSRQPLALNIDRVELISYLRSQRTVSALRPPEVLRTVNLSEGTDVS